jgi:hypothetical protein
MSRSDPLNKRGQRSSVLRALPSRQPGARWRWSSHPRSISTATKYRNTSTAICHVAESYATLPCSATNIVGAA